MKRILTLLLAAGLILAAAAPASADTFIGDAAAFGTALPAGTGTRADSNAPLSYVYSPEVPGVAFTSPSTMMITLTTVNLLNQDAGMLTPFVARYTGGPTTLSSSYILLAK